MNRKGKATLHRKGAGTLTDRLVASDTMEAVVKLVMAELPDRRRSFTVMHDDMEYHASEVENLARQFAGDLDRRIASYRLPVIRVSRERAGPLSVGQNPAISAMPPITDID
jgi:hypothetical protein